MCGAAVRKVVTIDRGDDSVCEVQMFDGFSDVSRFFDVETTWLTFTDRTESTVSGADVAGEHERGSAI